MICPHCRVAFHEEMRTRPLDVDVDGGWVAVYTICPNCLKMTVYLAWGKEEYVQTNQYGSFSGLREAEEMIMVKPRGSSRPPAPVEVPPIVASDYTEACLVHPLSPKASAALSRRCLQHILRETANVKPSDLYSEIQEVLNAATLPSHILEGLDAVRVVGNFAAHPMKSRQTGEVLPVEPGEADWNLDVIEALFDYYYVQPALTSKKRDALNAKLLAAGKPPLR